MNEVHIGIDVSKSALEVDLLDGTTRSLPNDEPGLRELPALLRRLGGDSAAAVYEATGGYERGLARALEQAGVAALRCCPSKARQFARSQGMLAKTDALDARSLTAYAKASALAPKPPLDARLEAMRELLRRRSALVEQSKAEACRLEHLLDALSRRQARALIKLLDRQAAQLERELLRRARGDERLAPRLERLLQVKGVGPIAALNALLELPELGAVGDRQAAAMAGLAPYARDSGRSFGKRRIGGGNAAFRKAMFMPAQCAARFNPVLKAFYERLRAKGKPFKVAIAAVMRKLVVLMNRILKDPDFKIT